ncbi:peptidoglycan D,D-transpeptidase FtsI family protein [Salinisphaera hydrothermalis]|uniref:Peptidoglycan D,D-transpeptidase FtsI n=1 Tax=Salinisphaera hydrothermalis (strain C41B8) TaxID=1304275 RepID=A0A084IP75_SALHC|nr:penicillin-binding protein 2 [Salinisphaera hydrothermalis]KEZ78509.1 peptidoglycan glycosyltransferase [Salinisphaera hydrothermalis C41B8]
MSRDDEPQHFTPSRWRAWFILGVFVVFGSTLVWRAVDLQVFDEQFLTHQGDIRHVRTVKVPAHRGAILDRNGLPLALSAPTESVWAVPSAVLKAPDKIAKLASRLGMSTHDLKRDLERHKSRQFLYLKRQLSPYDAHQVMAVDAPGIFLQREYKRYYPAGEAAAQLIGLTNIDGKGQSGMELARNGYLSGSPGERKVVKDGRGRVVDDLDEFKAPHPGHDLKLTIDSRLQYLAYRDIKEAVLSHKAKDGIVVMLDPDNGQLLAVASYPSFNPNDRSTIDQAGMRLRAATDVMEPGSTAKPIVLSGALNKGLYTTSSIIHTKGWFQVGRLTVKDELNYGNEDFAKILQKSSNVGAAHVGLKMGPQAVWQDFRNFGFGETTGSGFPGERFGVLRDYYTWDNVETATASYGYGFAVTPLQLARAYGAIADNGELRSLRLILGKGADMHPPPQQAIKPSTAATMRQLLRGVISPEGTAERAKVPGYTVAGKTGTARKISDDGYHRNQHRALFVGMAPAKNPRLVTLVVVDAPTKGSYYGGTVAAPVFSKIMQSALRILHVPPDNPSVLTAAAESSTAGG